LRAIFRREGNTLVPACQNAVKVLAQIGDRGEGLIDYTQGRNAGNHRRFFAFVNLTFDMQEGFDDPEVWRKFLEMCAGHFNEVISPKTGEKMFIAKSIEWGQLGEGEFRELFGRVIQAFIDRYGQGITKEQLDMVVGF